ncbi:hypothetical protein LEP1GSC202_2819 [Leptospira yanagawae serovar Saopaulo str. Sao Paulo = ATCC 700523]|uniref:Uncharacterized protein n=1 Tax=Leptospira yanagawae serovar Saopaulo str. Sao Paulo = ATCC 700523 TaxID=1249483 RepID=A0A5E8HBJ0_9LEPT|nr:hypothetical protein [Leptospira yanagawae]EOQ88655.1 hypothetical protein LEP1GSC202_2819 [Leptospira yanagawae serovar Saopaulo str. Sao Paulo = ATCC 700523]
MKAKILLLILCFQFLPFCKSEEINYQDKNLFWDGIFGQSGIQLFTLFDAFPALKSGLTKLEALEFNIRLNSSLEPIRRNLPNILLNLGYVFNDDRNAIKQTLRFVSDEFQFLRENKTNLFRSVSTSFDKIRRSQLDLLPNLIPVSNQTFQELLRTKSESDVTLSIQRINDNLKDADFISFIKKTELILGKLLIQNEETRTGLTNVMSGIFQFKSPEFYSSLSKMIGGIGEGFFYQAGIGSGFKSSGTSLKELFINFEDYYTPQGTKYSSIYSNPSHSGQIRNFLSDFIINLRQIIVTPANLIKNQNQSYIANIAESYHKLQFTSSLNKANDSLYQMLCLDLFGRNRTLDVSGESISLLEHLLFTIGVTNDFGYYWSNDPSEPQIESSSGGVITLGDSLFSLSSKLKSVGIVVRNATANSASQVLSLPNSDLAIQNGDTVFGIGIPIGTIVTSVNATSVQLSNPISSSLNNSPVTFKRSTSISNLGISAAIWNSAISGRVKKNGQVENVNLNTAVLSRIENDVILSNANDPIYSKTLPWILASLSSILYSGQGPYFNQNRKNSFGQIETIDGRIYKDSFGNDLIYQKEWNTSKYKIGVRNSENGDVQGVGLGGFEYPESDLSNGSHYHITEINIPENERAVGSDEEAFYKNFYWLMYQKRYVIIVPVALEALGDTIQDAVYIVIIANGLKGLIDVKPYCNETQCSEFDSGRWLHANTFIKNDIKSQGNLQNFSSIAGDSCFLVEVWGYGISASANSNLGFVDDTTFQQVYRLLFSKFNSPSEFYGPIPPVISAGFPSFERLGFFSEENIREKSFAYLWEKRNHLLPIVASIAHTSVLTSDSSQNKNSFILLTNLIQVLNRPFLFESLDPTAASDMEDTASPNRNITIRQYRIRGNSGVFGIRSPNMPNLALYYPNAQLRSYLSFLIENQRKWNDGILNSMSKGHLLESILETVYYFGDPKHSDSRNLTIIGLQQLFYEFKLDVENPDSSQFSINQFSYEIENYISSLVLERGKNPNHSAYSFLDDVECFLSTLLNAKSPYSYSNQIKPVLIILSDADLTSGEIYGFLEWLGQIFIYENGNPRYRISFFLSETLPNLLEDISGKSIPVFQILESLTGESSFLEYFYKRTISEYSFSEIWLDLENFCKSSMIQNPSKDKKDLFYNLSQTFQLFSQLLSSQTRPMQTDYWFVDQVNRNNELSVFDHFNFIFSKK